jgi:hypothetical protein
MANDLHRIEARGISVTLDLAVGHVRELRIERDGRTVTPLHTAPWLDEPEIADDAAIPPSLRYLSGDFFCAPFGASDVDPEAPAHGWSANSRWRLIETTGLADGMSARYRLERTILGATLEKTLTVRDHHPFLYETHVFTGGTGALPVANHARTRFPGGGRLAFSPKERIATPAEIPEPDPARGRSVLAYPASVTDAHRVPTAAGGTVDITRYPFAERHEDIMMLVEARGSRLGWFAAARPDSRDLVLSLKRPSDFPVTILWVSNGGRDYAPWNSRHVGVLGFEEARSFFASGHKASLAPNALTEAGIPTTLTLGGRVELHNVVGGLPVPAGGQPVAGVGLDQSRLALRLEDGTELAVPIDSGFLGA